jgi:hypothetical protein
MSRHSHVDDTPFEDPFDTSKIAHVSTHLDWPEEVTLLTAKDLCWNFETTDGRCDLIEWLNRVFADENNVGVWQKGNAIAVRARAVLEEVLAKRLDMDEVDLWEFLEKAAKDEWPSLAWQAACWNEAMSVLDYEVPAVSRAEPSKGKRNGNNNRRH